MTENWELHWKDYYKILQVHRSAEPEVIEAAYKKLASIKHPDVNQDSTAVARMKDINEAHEVISDIVRKKLYDAEWDKKVGQPNEMPKPVADPPVIHFYNIEAKKTVMSSFIVRNDGGAYSKLNIDDPGSWIRVTKADKVNPNQRDLLPAIVEIALVGQSWESSYVDYINVRLIDEKSGVGGETRVKVELNTMPEPVVASTVNRSFPTWGKWVVALGIIGLVLGIVIPLLHRSSKTLPPVTSVSSPSLLPTQTVSSPTLSVIPPMNSKIAFMSKRDGNWEIYSMNSNGSNPVRLTNSLGTDGRPTWSPDGTRIAFVSDRDGNTEIYIMNADGSNQTKRTNDAMPKDGPSWSPDGTRIAFYAGAAGNKQIYEMNIDGSKLIKLTERTGYNCDPVWSPDSTKIAFEYSPDNDWDHFEIYIMNADGSNQMRLTKNSSFDAFPAWSPDGRKIAFTSNRDGNYEIYAMSADGSNQMRLTNNPSRDEGPAWSPDGTKMMFTSLRDPTSQIYIMDSDGSSQIRLTTNSSDNSWPK